MKQLKDIITEKLRLDNNLNRTYTCHPQTSDELRSIIEERLKEDKNADMNDIDVSKITSLCYHTEDGWYGLFFRLDPHNIKIDKWDVSKVEDMSYMFYGCENFNCDLSKRDVSNVKDMNFMLYQCENFDCDLSNWDASNVKRMTYTFHNCKSLKNIPAWYKK